jgi:hypothetical protein
MTPAVPFMATAVLLLPLVGIGAAFVAHSLASGNYRAWDVLAINHLATMGWGTLAAMGALHQLFPAMIGASIRPDRRTALQFALTLAGMILLIAGFLAHAVLPLMVGGTVFVVSVLMFVTLLLRALPFRRRWTLPATGVLLSLGYLVLTVSWGLLMALNWQHRFWPSLFAFAGVGTHVSLGLIGWFVQLVISVSYYLLPRFMHAREIGDARLRMILPLLNAAVLLLTMAALTGAVATARIGVALLSITGAIYSVDLGRFLGRTRGQKPDLTTHHWWAVWGQTILLLTIGLTWAAGLLHMQGQRLAVAAGVMVLLGWVTLAIMGQFYKVTPFLMWFYRYAKGMTPLEVPRLSTPYYPCEGVLPFYFTVAGSLILATAIVLQRPDVGALGGLFLVAGGFGVWYLMAISWIRAAVLDPPTSGPSS